MKNIRECDQCTLRTISGKRLLFWALVVRLARLQSTDIHYGIFFTKARSCWPRLFNVVWDQGIDQTVGE